MWLSCTWSLVLSRMPMLFLSFLCIRLSNWLFHLNEHKGFSYSQISPLIWRAVRLSPTNQPATMRTVLLMMCADLHVPALPHERRHWRNQESLMQRFSWGKLTSVCQSSAMPIENFGRHDVTHARARTPKRTPANTVPKDIEFPRTLFQRSYACCHQLQDPGRLAKTTTFEPIKFTKISSQNKRSLSSHKLLDDDTAFAKINDDDHDDNGHNNWWYRTGNHQHPS